MNRCKLFMSMALAAVLFSFGIDHVVHAGTTNKKGPGNKTGISSQKKSGLSRLDQMIEQREKGAKIRKNSIKTKK